MKIKKLICGIFVMVLLLCTFSIQSFAADYASYRPYVAADYAKKYGKSANPAYKRINNDCTGFVSQAIAHGGVYSISSSFNEAPSILKDWIMETNNNAWYMIKKTRTIGFDYWKYSNTWAFVNDFYNFHKARAGYSVITGILNQTTPSNAGFERTLRQNAAVGQVWQLANHHSIIITRVDRKADGYNYVWYSAHDKDEVDQDIQTFFNFCNQHRDCQIRAITFWPQFV